jgi:hypothetical protein
MKQKDKATLKYKLLMRLESYVYRHVDERLEEGLRELVRQNNVLHGNIQADTFYYGGGRWPKLALTKKPTPILHETLEEKASELINWWEQIEFEERPLVLAFLRKLLNHTDDVEQIFRLLPGSLHDAVRDILNAAELRVTALPMEEVVQRIGASEKAVRLFNIRMMSNLIGA